jgi:DNA segregation ATPase FtsK/SpoIIIE, S-DNA-T family
MARKRKKKRKSKKAKSSAPVGLSDSVKQGLFAIVLIAVSVLSLLSFVDLAGVVGERVDELLAYGFGWDRWLFAIVLFIFGWRAMFPNKDTATPGSLVGVLLFFLSFNGIVNLLTIGIVMDAEAAAGSGGAIGLPVSGLLTQAIDFWGAFVVALAIMVASIFLIFNLSFHAAIEWLQERRGERTESEDWEEDEDEEILHVEEEESWDDSESESDESEDEEESLVATPVIASKKGESVMTTTSRRRIKVPVDLLEENSTEAESGDTDRAQEIIQTTFEHFGINVSMASVRVGPTVTQYAFKPHKGVKLSRIVALQNDLALALAAHPIRIEAPIPGKALVGIEVPNQTIGSVGLREMLESRDFKGRKSNAIAPLGKDVGGNVVSVQVDKAPHMLVAGATGSGKSVCLNVIIAALLYQNGPDDLKFIMVDPKRVELGVYAGIPHLLVPPITAVDEAVNALKWAVREMERRLDHLAKAGARDIDSYNAKSKERMPKIVIVIDELADLMSQNKRDVEAVIVRIAQMARAAGIHLVLATQRPSVDVITGTIKANIPTRLAFAVASQVDSKTMLDISGAEKLLGRGDMLVSTPQISKPKRLQGAYISDKEIDRIVKFLKKEGAPDYNYQVTEDTRTGGSVFKSDDSDPLLEDAIQVVLQSKKASTSFLQRRMRIGYSRAARIVDLLEEMGIVGPQNGSKPRTVLITEWPVAGSEPEEVEEEEAWDASESSSDESSNEDSEDDFEPGEIEEEESWDEEHSSESESDEDADEEGEDEDLDMEDEEEYSEDED